jgi:hypothetical protein
MLVTLPGPVTSKPEARSNHAKDAKVASIEVTSEPDGIVLITIGLAVALCEASAIAKVASANFGDISSSASSLTSMLVGV